MMYLLNKIAWGLLNPAMLGLLAAVICFALHRFRIMRMLGWLSIIWLWLWCTPLMTNVVGRSLESDFVLQKEDGLPRMREVAEYPVCDAIVDLGGGIGAYTNFYSGACLNASADRAYFSALLWNAGKAPVIIPSGVDCHLSDGRFLMDLGVPESAIVADNAARNTEENAKFVNALLRDRVRGRKPRALLVTSAWHMKRSLLMFEKYAPDVEVVPATCDFECINGESDGFYWQMLLPSFETAGHNSIYFHEWIGYWWYKYLRR